MDRWTGAEGRLLREVALRLCFAVLGVLAVTACGGSAGTHVTVGGLGTAAPSTAAPLTSADIRQLGEGALYVVAGPNPMSGNVWWLDPSSGAATQLTHNQPTFGISSVSASEAGLVVSDARSGIDELGIVEEDGVRLLVDGHVVTPAIDDHGRIATVRPPEIVKPDGDRFFHLELKENADTAGRTVYRQQTPDMGGAAWGPGGRLAVGSSGFPKPSRAEVLIFDSRGRLEKRLGAGLQQLGAPVWGERAPGIAVRDEKKAVIVDLAGRRTPLPTGWAPICWSPNGSSLLLTQGNQIALWAGGQLGRPIKTQSGTGIFECSWIASPAPLAAAKPDRG